MNKLHFIRVWENEVIKWWNKCEKKCREKCKDNETCFRNCFEECEEQFILENHNN